MDGCSGLSSGESSPLPAAQGPQTFSHYPAIPPPPSLKLRLKVIEEGSCPYLLARSSITRATWAESLDDATFESLLDRGFRRSGRVIYQQACVGCRRCVPMRVDASTFVPSRSQRRILRKNADVRVTAGIPVVSTEKIELYAGYLATQHAKTGERRKAGEPADEPRDELLLMLYDSPVSTLEMTYHAPDGTLLGVGICDITPNILSSVYFFWNPSHRKRSLGWFSMLQEIALARRLGRRWYHLGYWVEGAETMDYKRHIGPHELLASDGVWRPGANG